MSASGREADVVDPLSGASDWLRLVTAIEVSRLYHGDLISFLFLGTPYSIRLLVVRDVNRKTPTDGAGAGSASGG
jgi:hypothetical protein